MDKHAVSMIFLARHLFYLRTATLLACGAFRMRLTRFLIIDAFAAALSSSVMISVGYLTAQHLPALFRFLQTVKIASLVVILIMLVLALIYFRKRRAVEE
jgi:membrane protein DedA with SNARE-associated domain